MSQKKIIEETYQASENVDVFDSTRKRFKFQKYKHNTEAELLLDTISMIEGDAKILDVACGTGRMFREVANHFDKDDVEYHGVDTSEEMMKNIPAISEKYDMPANLKVGDATKLPYPDNTFDVVYTYHLTWHLPVRLQQDIILEMQRVCKPGGYVVFDILNECFIWEKVKGWFGKEKLPDIYKMKHKDVKKIIGNIDKLEKLNDFPILSSFWYTIANLVNDFRYVLPKQFFHMLYYRVEV